MFFKLNFVPRHPVYKLHIILKVFFHQAVRKASFGEIVFPDWFQAVLTQAPTLRTGFQDLFKIISSLKRQRTETQFHQAFLNQNRISRLCGDSQYSIQLLPSLTDTQKDKITDFFEYLYKQVLNLSTFEQESGGGSLHAHHQRFREINGLVCPFCGIECYPDVGGRRTSYDHYLARSVVPFAAVNFRNLVPMCQACNEPPNKGSTEIYVNTVQNRRRVAFYPYKEQAVVRIEVGCEEKPTLRKPKGKWRVAVVSLQPEQEEKIQTWDSVFKISQRLALRIEAKNSVWVLETLRFGNSVHDIDQLLSLFEKRIAMLSDSYLRRNKEEAILQQAFFEYLRQCDDKEMLEGFVQIAQTEYISTQSHLGYSLLQ